MLESLTTAILAVGGLAMTAAASPQPIKLDVQNQGERLILTVTGESATEVSAHYSLKVVTGAGGNRSTHAGNVHLVPGTPQTVSKVTMSVAQGQPWTVTLDVTPSDAAEYTISKTSD